MPDWTSSMQQTFEYYVVDPGTWKDKRRLTNVISSTIQRDSSADTLGSATINVTESVGECYIRIYLVTSQNGLTERFPLGTYLVQTPSSSFDGKVRSVTMDAYTPLLELKENQPDIGYFVPKDSNIMDTVQLLARVNSRVPVIPTPKEDTTHSDFIANTDDTWLSYLSDLASTADFSFDLDDMGRIIFTPVQKLESLQPVWTYTDDNSSILYPAISMNHDLYGIPNVVEVTYCTDTEVYFARVVNDDPNSPISIPSRGRKITHRVVNPELTGSFPTERQVNEYAEELLKALSTIEYQITYTHAYCPVRVGDCVRFNYSRAGLKNVKAKIISQNISCTPGCPVEETAIFTKKLWGDE